MSMIHWTEQEYQTLAQALRQQFPERAKAQVATPDAFVFTTNEVVVAMRATLGKDRQRSLSKSMTQKLTGRVIAAGGGSPRIPRKRAQPANGYVHWKANEWRYYALALTALYPHFDLVNSKDLSQLRLTHLNKACLMMEPGRQRTFKARTGPIKYLLEIYAKARDTGDAMFFGTGAEPQQPVLARPAPAEPAKPAKPTSAPKLNQATCKVYWKKSEWIKIAAELHRQYPHAKYPERNHLGTLNSADVCGAQFVLPEDRRRKNLKAVAMSSMRKHLLEAFKAVRHTMMEEAQEKVVEAQQAHDDMLARAASVAVAPNQWEVVFKPLIDLLVREVGAQLLPALIEGLTQAGHVAIPRPTPPAQLSLAPTTAPAPRKAVLRIAIVGNENKNSYGAELDRYFPTVDFVYLDKHFEAAKNCDKVIALIKFISHSTEGKVRQIAGDRYVRVNGSISDMKRVISGWLSDAAAKGDGVIAA